MICTVERVVRLYATTWDYIAHRGPLLRTRMLVLGALFAVLYVVALTACASPDAPSAPRATVQQSPVAQVQDVASESACWTVTEEQPLIDRFNAMPDVNTDPVAAKAYYQELLADLPAPTDAFCTDEDQALVAKLRAALIENIAEAG